MEYTGFKLKPTTKHILILSGRVGLDGWLFHAYYSLCALSRVRLSEEVKCRSYFISISTISSIYFYLDIIPVALALSAQQ